MTSLHVVCSETFDAEREAFWNAALKHADFGELVLPWSEAVRHAGPSNLEILYLEVYRDSAPIALAVLHVMRRLDLSAYMGRAVNAVFSPLRKLGCKPLAVDLAFLEVPVANISGIRIIPGCESRAQSVAEAVVAYVRQHSSYGVLCLKASPTQAGEGAFGQLGMLTTGFLANMGTAFTDERSFEDYLKRLSPRHRTQCRAYAKEFAAAGGTIEIVEGSAVNEALYATMNQLYAGTLAYHEKHSNLQLPIPLSHEFFRRLVEAIPGRSRVFLARLRGDPIAFSLVLESGVTSYFTHCGLDYSRTVPTRAYFNLYYAMITDSIVRGLRSLDMGAEAYQVKKKLGAIPFPTVYHFEVRNAFLRAVTAFVARNLASQEGSKLK